MKLAGLLLAACATMQAACLIGGSVVDADSGKPLPRTRVFARPVGAFGTPAILRVSDTQGAFCFGELAPGTYEVVTERAGYLVSVYGARPGSDDGIPFEVNGPNELPPLTIRMLAGALIAGTVLDADGEPVWDANVQLSRKVWEKLWTSDHVRDTNTDEHGGFRFGMLPPGTYYVSVMPPTGDQLGETFYDGSLGFAHATPILLKAGQAIDNLVVTTLRPASRHFSGRISERLRPAPPRVSLELQIDGAMAGVVEIAIGKDGTFSAEGLAPTEYRFWLNNVDPGAHGSVDLTSGDVSGLVIEPDHMVEFQIAARMEGQDALARVPLTAIDRESGGGPTGQLDDAGVCRFHELPSGVYRFEPRRQGAGEDQGQALYVKRVLIGGRPQNDVWLDLRGTAPASVELVLGSKPAAIEGRLELRQGETHALAITVVAVDEARSGAEVKYQATVADNTGGFALGDLAPGKWRVFAIEGFEEGPWGSPELAQALREKSVAVELQEGRKSSLKVTVIGSEEWEAALKKVGM